MDNKNIDLSVVVINYKMNRELPRTILSLSAAMQKGIAQSLYELVVVDNGSPETIAVEREIKNAAEAGVPISFYRFDKASPSPAAAVNFGVRKARGNLIGVMIDGARLASPGLLAGARMAARLHERPVITSLAFHLGPAVQAMSILDGYDQSKEDALLDSVRWTEDGYRLFDISVLALSSAGGYFLPVAESNSLFMPCSLWHELGGLDENFTSPGGGLVNHDTFIRACELPNTCPIVLLGEGTFHQVHGGISTNAVVSPFDDFHDEYVRIRHKDLAAPTREAILLGRVPPQALPVIESSARIALDRLGRSGQRSQ